MIYIIGGNMKMAQDYCRKLGVHHWDKKVVRVYSAMTFAQGPGLRGIEFHPGDTIYTTGLQFATARERLEVEDQIAISSVRCEVEVNVDPATDVTLYRMLSKEQIAAAKEMAEIEELRRLLMEQQS